MYDELIRQFRDKASRYNFEGKVGLARDYSNAADAINELWREVQTYRKARGLLGFKDGGQEPSKEET